MDVIEVRLRCLEAAARNPAPHPDGYVIGVKEAAVMWAEWVLADDLLQARDILGLPEV